MKFSSLMAGVAAAGLVIAPVAAQAGTKASTAIAAPADFGSRSSAAVAKQNKASPALWLVGLLAVGAAGFGLYKLIDDDNKSRGS